MISFDSTISVTEATWVGRERCFRNCRHNLALGCVSLQNPSFDLRLAAKQAQLDDFQVDLLVPCVEKLRGHSGGGRYG